MEVSQKGASGHLDRFFSDETFRLPPERLDESEPCHKLSQINSTFFSKWIKAVCCGLPETGFSRVKGTISVTTNR